MDIDDLTARVAEIADALKLRYYVTGSIASSAWGEPRSTQDIDVVMDLPLSKVDVFCRSFGDDYYADEVAAAEAVRSRGMFSVLSFETGLKIDVILPSDPAAERVRLDRARGYSLKPGVQVMFSSPEDCILSKMEFFRMGGSQKHVRDIFGILGVQANLDLTYIDRSAEALGLAAIWGELKAGRRPRHESDTY